MEFDKKYQQSLLTMTLRNYEFLVRCRDAIQPEYFDTSRSVIAEMILKYFDRFRVLPTERALTDLFEEVMDRTSHQKYEKIIRRAFDKLFEEEYPEDADYIESKIIDFARNQSYMALAKSIPDLAEAKEYQEIDKMVHKISKIGVNNAVMIRSSDAIKDDNLQLDFSAANVVATGIPELDHRDVLEGGLAEKELGVIIAPPNVGKSMFLNHLGNAACMQGKRVYHVTLEMAAAQVWKRYVSSIASISGKMIKMNMENTRKQVQEFYSKHGGELIIDERPTKRFSPRDLDAQIDIMNRAGEMPDLILVDYGDIMKSDSNFQSKYDNQAEVYVDLRAICMKYNTRMWVPSQGNRASSEKKNIDNEDVAGAFDKTATADIVMSINMTKEEYQDGIARIFVSKNRRGKKNLSVEVDTQYDQSKFVAKIIIEANESARIEEDRAARLAKQNEASEDSVVEKPKTKRKKKKKRSKE